MYTSATSVFVLLAVGATAMVLPRDDCSSIMEYQNLVQNAPFSLPNEVVANAECTSTLTTECQIEKGYAHTVSFETTISGSVSVGLDIDKIFSLGVEAGFAFTWGTADETSTGITLICPEGGIQCAAMATAQAVIITGQTRLPPGGLGCPGDNDWHNFTIQAPLKNAPNDGGSVTNFQICLENCGSAAFPDSCETTKESGIVPCPGSAAACQGSFGGTCSSIPTPPA
ncbi:uncharacterized protein BDR25DRAFT_309365 [Lindgomyces ingoldianus]|uniref:Uncharacterized protein n=1 Tax=Lindgomyces ingoldianus TaxID=673940 RepID=A0ACB6RFE5_9PLEO|nr:uncharacterized protein BDR25DRAFT_309365 [Lindgomyces ingoldianus]KAF2477052.1 hypothetical protein BDR25DRAFT_309365 [Lindgomyces ingoldianus]